MYDIHIPKHPQGPVTPHTIVTLPNSNGMQLLLCYDNEGVYVNTYGKVHEQEPRNFFTSRFWQIFFHFFFLLRAEGFYCSLVVLYGGLGISKLQFLIKKIKIKFLVVNFFQF